MERIRLSFRSADNGCVYTSKVSKKRDSGARERLRTEAKVSSTAEQPLDEGLNNAGCSQVPAWRATTSREARSRIFFN